MLKPLSHRELVQVLELSNRCLTASSPAELETIISSIHDLATYRKAALCALSVNAERVALTHYVNHSYGGEWAGLYVNESFERTDPILGHGGRAEGVFGWDEIAPPGGESGATFLEAAAEFGLTEGVSFSCAGISPGFRSMLSFVGVPHKELERTRRMLALVGPHLHESYRRVLEVEHRREPASPPVEALPNALSAREVEVLAWAQQGKTYWEIGSILGISQRTVKFHVARIKAKLDVVSTAHAIAKAMRMGLIT